MKCEVCGEEFDSAGGHICGDCHEMYDREEELYEWAMMELDRPIYENNFYAAYDPNRY